MKDRWGAMPLGEPRCEGCDKPLRFHEERDGRCDDCTLRVVRAFNAVDRAVKGRAA